MRDDMEALYDAHGHRLYAHCWSLLGDRGAADAVRDALGQASRRPPGDTVLWLHRMARLACTERGAFGRGAHPGFVQAGTDPLLRAAAELPADQREALLLAAGEWLNVRDIAQVFRSHPDLIRDLLHDARVALEHRVVDALMHDPSAPTTHTDVIEAFERGRLPHLLARRAPDQAPPGLRDHVFGIVKQPQPEPGTPSRTHPGPGTPSRTGPQPDGPYRLRAVPGEPSRTPEVPSRTRAMPDRPSRTPLVVIGPRQDEEETAKRRRKAAKGIGAVAGVAASVAAGLVMTWPSATGTGTGANSLAAPPVNNAAPDRTPSAPDTDPGSPAPEPDRGENPGTPDPAPATGGQGPSPEAPPSSAPAPGTEEPSQPRTPSGSWESPTEPTTPTEPSPDEAAPPQEDQLQPAPDEEEDRDRDRRSTRAPIRDTIDGIVGGILDPITGTPDTSGTETPDNG
jgi:DNA-directed RNA polymerase specialized sigma24 family protein